MSRNPWYNIDIDKGAMRDIEEVSRWCRLLERDGLSCRKRENLSLIP
jgi:hypothetical protein